MNTAAWWNTRILRAGVIAVLCVLVCDGFVTTFIVTKPFWIDEWRVIYNLKFRSVPGLWGTLDYLQQFPRLYLSLVKCVTAPFDYSYWSLRLPSFIIGTSAVALAWRVMRRLYPAGDALRYLFVLIIVSSSAFTNYYVQVKQYTMDIALSLLAVWQVLELLRLREGQLLSTERYALLCLSLLLAPFFSYTYPIAIAPAFALAAVPAQREGGQKRRIHAWAPLLLCALSIGAFYMLDARQLMADGGMKEFWRSKSAAGLDARGVLEIFYLVFAQIGAGFVFSLLFGILGIMSFLLAAGKAFTDVCRGLQGTSAWIRLYSVLLILLAATLFLTGRLPLGEPRLNAFLTASVSILIVDLLHHLQLRFPRRRAVTVLCAILYAGVAGNILTTVVAGYTDGELPKKKRIYATIAAAIRVAKARHLPVLATPGVAYPYEGDRNLPFTTTVPGDWIFKTHPAYRVADSIPVYRLAAMDAAPAVLATLPPTVRAAVACDGMGFRVIARQ